MRIYNHAFHRRRSIITGPPGWLATVVFGCDHATPIRVEQDFARIEPRPACGIECTVNSITVDLPGSYPGYEDVPIVIRSVSGGIDRDHMLGSSVINTIKK